MPARRAHPAAALARPAPLPPHLYAKVLGQGEEAHRALGCSGYSRVDFLVTETGDCFLLEVNTLPGMTALSLLPEIAQGAVIGFAELVERIFDPFFSRRADGVAGTGLGLTIVKTIVDRMQGSISVKSTQGQGTCFSIRLPLADATFDQIS